jgi:hypothetical protein
MQPVFDAHVARNPLSEPCYSASIGRSDEKVSDIPTRTTVCAQLCCTRRTRPQCLTLCDPASDECFSPRNTRRLQLLFNSAYGAIENIQFIFSKVPNSAELERIPNPSLLLKLHLLCKYANITKCPPPCACVLVFS